jgi:hypothetical protein
MITATDPSTATRAAALFVSDLSAADRPTPAEAETAIGWALVARGGAAGVAGDVAQEYGEHPELAAARMRWARGVVDSLDRPATARASASAAAPAKARATVAAAA